MVRTTAKYRRSVLRAPSGPGRYQFSFQVCFHCLVSITFCSGTYFDSRLCQCCLCATTKTSADQYINSLTF